MPRAKPTKSPTSLLSSTEAVINAAGRLDEYQQARAELLLLLAAKLTSAAIELKDVQKLAGEWRAALREFEQGAPRAKSFADRLRDEAEA